MSEKRIKNAGVRFRFGCVFLLFILRLVCVFRSVILEVGINIAMSVRHIVQRVNGIRLSSSEQQYPPEEQKC